MELFEILLPVLTTIIGGILGYLANYFIERKNFKRQEKYLQEERLMNLSDEFIEILDSLGNYFNDTIAILSDLEGLKITKKIEHEYDEELDAVTEKFIEYQRKANVAAYKFRFGQLVDIQKDLDTLYSFLRELDKFLEKKDDALFLKPIKKKDVEYLTDLNERFIKAEDVIMDKMAMFYQSRFLPHK
ncbi:MAG: hypothetical protein ABJK11_07985 [Balneola sp.]